MKKLGPRVCSSCGRELDFQNDRNISVSGYSSTRSYTCGDCVTAYAYARREKDLPTLMAAAGVPRRFLTVTPVQIADYSDPLIYITGIVSSGKTHLACRILARWLIDDGKGLYKSSVRIALGLQSCFGEGGGSIKDALAEIADYKGLLIIDDFGTERQSPFVKQSWYAIIDARWSNVYPTIITSNLSLAQVASSMDADEAKIADRLKDFCLYVTPPKKYRGKGGPFGKKKK